MKVLPFKKPCYFHEKLNTSGQCEHDVVGYKVNMAGERFYVCQIHWDLLKLIHYDDENFHKIGGSNGQRENAGRGNY